MIQLRAYKMWGLFAPNGRIPLYVGKTKEAALHDSWLCDSGGRPKEDWRNILEDSGYKFRRILVTVGT